MCLVCLAISVLVQHAGATVRVEVRTKDAPVAGASVVIAGATTMTDQQGVVRMSVRPGRLEITIAKDGFVPATASLDAAAGEERVVTVALETLEEKVTVIASTRTERRIEEQPMRVEVLVREEIEEKMLMTPGDIVMMLNEMGGNARAGDIAIARRGKRADSGHARALHAFSFRRVAALRGAT